MIVFFSNQGTTIGNVVRCNVNAFQSGKFEIVGRMLATMIIQGGELPRIFSSAMCDYIQGG